MSASADTQSWTLSSKVITNPETWADGSLLLPHEAIRRMTSKMLVSKVTTSNCKSYATWYNTYFLQVVHHHHEAEEKIYFPWVATKATLPEKLTSTHEELLQAMNSIKDKLAQASAGDRSDDFLDRITEEIHDMAERTEAHLADEEQLVPKLVLEHFAREEERPIVERIVAGIGFSGNKAFLPLITDSLTKCGSYGPITPESFASQVPGIVRFLNWAWFLPDMRKNNLAVLDSFRA